MGRRVRLRSVIVTFGAAPGADVAIEIGNDDTLAAATLSTFTTVATADDVGGTHTFTTHSRAAGRYVLIWFTKLPPDVHGGYAAQVYNVVIRGSHPARSRPRPRHKPQATEPQATEPQATGHRATEPQATEPQATEP
jgi:hypothetical protein